MLYFALLAWDSWLFIRWRSFTFFTPLPLFHPRSWERAAEVLIALEIRSRRPTCVPNLLPVPTLCVCMRSFPIKCLKTGSFLKIESSTAKNSSGPAVVPRNMEKNRRGVLKRERERGQPRLFLPPPTPFSLRENWPQTAAYFNKA